MTDKSQTTADQFKNGDRVKLTAEARSSLDMALTGDGILSQTAQALFKAFVPNIIASVKQLTCCGMGEDHQPG